MRLIDATKAIESIDEIAFSMSVCISTDYCHGMTAMKDAAIHAIEEQPTVDAVQVVANDRNKLCPINHGLRCKDIDNCAFWCEWGQCALKAIAVACADGERR